MSDIGFQDVSGAYKSVPIFRQGQESTPEGVIGLAFQSSDNPHDWTLRFPEGSDFLAFIKKSELKFLTLSGHIIVREETRIETPNQN